MFCQKDIFDSSTEETKFSLANNAVLFQHCLKNEPFCSIWSSICGASRQSEMMKRKQLS